MARQPDWRLYEEQVINTHVLKNKGNAVWPWIYIPEDELYNCGFIHDFNRYRKEKHRLKAEGKTVRQEYGLDGLAINDDGSYTGIQAKCWNGRKLTANDLGSFLNVIYQRLVRKNINNKGIVYHTCGVQIDLKEDCLNSGGTITMIRMPLQKEIEYDMDETKYILNPEQEEARQSLNNWDWINPVGKLNMPPGIGKTLVFSNHIRDINYKNIIILSPLQGQAEQTLQRVRPFVPHHIALKIDCEGNGTRDINEIREALKNEALCSSTYDSVDVLLEAIKNDMEDDCILVIDEAHNIIGNKDITKLMDKFTRTLLVSGTPLNSYTTEEDEDEDLYETIYQLPFKTAIEKGYITNYEIYLPTIDKTGNTFIIEDMKDDEFGNQATFLTTGMLRTGSKRCLVYCKSVNECDIFKMALKKLFDTFHAENAEMFTLTFNTTSKERNQILKEFSKDDETIKFIMCVNILNEGIDIPICDSIFMDEIAISISDRGHIRAVQRLCRAVRKNKKNPFKIAHAFIYTHERSRLDNLFSLLKENDPEFHLRVKCISSNYDMTGKKETQTEETQQTGAVKNNIINGIETSQQRWMRNYELLKKYVEENDRLPPQSDANVGCWLTTQKTYIKNNKITQERKELLMKLEPFKAWYEDAQKKEKKERKDWTERYELLKKYVKENDRLPPQNYKDLGSWLRNQKENVKNNKLAQERKGLLMKLEPFKAWYGDDQKKEKKGWNDMYELLKKYTEEHNRLPLARNEELGGWLDHQKRGFKKNTITQEQKNQFMKLEPFKIWYENDELKEKKDWNIKYELLKKYIEENNSLPPQKHKELGGWLGNQKNLVKQNKNTKERKELLMKLEPFKVWYENDQTKQKRERKDWNEIYGLLKKYVNEHKKLPEIRSRIGNWLNTQKQAVKKEMITHERRKLLMELEPFKEWYEDDQKKERKGWNEMYEILKKYVEENNRLPSHSHKDLGCWLASQKENVKNNKITQERKDFLMELEAFKVWFEDAQKKERIIKKDWNEIYKLFKKYVEENNRLPLYNHEELGSWLARQKKSVKNEKITQERKDLLMELEPFKEWYNTLSLEC